MTSPAGRENPLWADDEALLHDVMAALKVPRPGEDDLVMAYDALVWGGVEADACLAELAYDSCLDDELLVRGQACSARRALAFHGDDLRVEIEVSQSRIEGQLIPAQPGEVSLMTRSGVVATTSADEVGYFGFPDPPAGAIRLECVTSGARVVTGWVIV